MTRQILQEAYASAEASLRLEGISPEGDPFYENLKARVIAGELSAHEADKRTLDHHRSLAAAGA